MYSSTVVLRLAAGKHQLTEEGCAIGDRSFRLGGLHCEIGVPGSAWLDGPPAALRIGIVLVGAFVLRTILPRIRRKAQANVLRTV